MSVYAQCSTFRTLHTDISNLPHLALAPHDILSTPSSSKASSFCPLTRHSLLQEHRFRATDFQSNARVENHTGIQSPSPPLSGLGIYADPDYSYRSNIRRISPGLDSSSFGVTPQPQPNNVPDFAQQNDTLAENINFLDPQLPKSWSFGSNASNSVFVSTVGDMMTQAIDPMDGLSLSYPFVDDPCHWSFDSLSAASGISVGLLAERISAAADLALQQISSSWADPTSSTVVLGNSFSRNTSQSPPWPILPCDKKEMSAAPGTNTYQYSAQWDGNSIGINPVEVMGDLDQTHKRDLPLDQVLEPYPPSVSAGSHLSSLFSSDSFFVDSLSGTSNSHTSYLSSLRSNMFFLSDGNAQEHPSDPILELSTNVCTDSDSKVQNLGTKGPKDILNSEKLQEGDENSDYEPPPCQGLSSKESSPFPSPRQKKRKRTLKKGDAKPVKTILRISDDAVRASIIKAEDLDIDLGTPVFDAHKGISLIELKAKAERYCLRNPGKEYDRRWLILFAGKLSAQGELISDFRCYVAGCTQSNKRRDHILIHVGAHLDQRPFGCLHCSARFLRRNECKRHEVSHSGIRPYVCTVCPYGATGTTFVRQDLLRRHVQRKHPQANGREEDKEGERVKAKRHQVKKTKLEKSGGWKI